MILNYTKNTYLFLFILMISCGSQLKEKKDEFLTHKSDVIELKTGAELTNIYLNKLKNKKVAVIANQTSVIFKGTKQNLKYKKKYVHLVDSLISLGINIKKVFSPEHGFRGNIGAGETVLDGVDAKTEIPLISLYGKNKKPTLEQLKDIDIVVFDIQDIGVRFYTYISTLHYVMEACAEANIPVILLDRPNPNANYIDGPILDVQHTSFVGMHPVPIVYGMTIGEYGKMINGEKWLNKEVQCNLIVIPMKGYNHNTKYTLPIKPSPNLPNNKAINLYPSLCLFEGTNISVGRGTDRQFQIYGSPYLEKTDFFFIPKSNNEAKYPKHQNRLCYGEDLSDIEQLSEINLSWLIDAYKQTSRVKTKFWTNFFIKLAGTENLKKQIESGVSEKMIKQSWKKDIENFKKIRKKYLLYKED